MCSRFHRIRTPCPVGFFQSSKLDFQSKVNRDYDYAFSYFAFGISVLHGPNKFFRRKRGSNVAFHISARSGVQPFWLVGRHVIFIRLKLAHVFRFLFLLKNVVLDWLLIQSVCVHDSNKPKTCSVFNLIYSNCFSY